MVVVVVVVVVVVYVAVVVVVLVVAVVLCFMSSIREYKIASEIRATKKAICELDSRICRSSKCNA